MKLTTETCQHGTSKSVMCLFCEAYNAGWTAALTEAMKTLCAHCRGGVNYERDAHVYRTEIGVTTVECDAEPLRTLGGAG